MNIITSAFLAARPKTLTASLIPVQARPDAGAAAAPDAAQAAVRGMEEAGKEADAQTADLGTAQEGT